MNTPQESLRVIPLQFDSNKLEQYFLRLSQAAPRKRPHIIDEAIGYLTAHPKRAIAGYQFLQESRQSRDAREFLREYTPTAIVDHLTHKGRFAHKEDFAAAFEEFEGEGEEIAEAMVVGYLARPTGALVTAGRNVELQKQAVLGATKIGHAFAQALFEIENPNVLRKALELFEEHIVRPEVTMNTIVDMLTSTALYGKPKLEAERAYTILGAIDVLMGLELGHNMGEKVKLYEPLTSPRVIELFGALAVVLPSGKRPNLRRTWGDPQERNNHKTSDMIDSIAEQTIAQVDAYRLSGKPIIVTVDKPQPLDVGDMAIRRFLGQIQKRLAPFEVETRIIEAPGGRFILVAGNEYEIRDPGTWMRIQAKVGEFVVDDIFASLKGEMRSEEIDTILEYLKPIPNPDKLKGALQDTLRKAQGGLHAISKRGIVNVLRLKDEEYLRDIGLTEIAYFQTSEGIKIVTKWSKATFSFLIDRSYHVHGLEGLSEENANWLTLVSLSYLKALKNRDEHEVEFLEEGEPEEEMPVTETEKELAEDSAEGGDTYARSPYLRVMKHGYRARVLFSSRIEQVDKEVAFHYGISLSDLNRLMSLIQSDETVLHDPNSYVNRFLHEHPAEDSLRHLINKILKTIMGKDSKPVWKRFDFKTASYTMLAPTVTKRPYDASGDTFMVTFVEEVDKPGAKPQRVISRGVGNEILESLNK